MTAAQPRGVAHGQTDQPPDMDAAIAALRLSGAGRFDPVRLHYLEVLARRSGTCHGTAKHLLDAKLAQVLAALRERFTQAQVEASALVERITRQYPQAETDLQQRLKEGDFKALLRCVAALETPERGTALAELTRDLAQQAANQPDGDFEVNGALRPELKATRYFRNTWSKLSVERQVSQALNQAPQNAGPINSHSLVLRSLVLMRDISPDYLNRFTSYVDTLLSLDTFDLGKPASADKNPSSQSRKKPGARRATSR